METESTLTASVLDGRMTVEDSDGGRWWPTDAGQAAIDAAEDPEAEAVRLAQGFSPSMGEWHQ